ncbi:ABC transporter ATP-binding protein [Carnobacterium mobile]|uniref:ABC transporter ATP-binding protein n=1 Tax=Carnobacterium mobile TaxID=2750 RepID=UPI000552A77D|nr:ABC transporter ATP-binding protein [Carnobacterium mobile]
MKSAQAPQPLIVLKEINKSFKQGKQESHILKGLDLTINEGDFVMIMGKSGSGKTTLMNIIGFLDRISTGTYLFRGEDVSLLNENQKSEYRNAFFGFVFQQFFLIDSLNVQQNVELPMVYKGMNNSKEKKEKAQHFLDLVGIGDKLKMKTSELSGGQQQRVAIARALINDPLLIMADEPTGALDSETGKTIMETLKKLNQEGKTIVMVTHDEDMTAYATRVIRMKDGAFEEEVTTV